jgi:hypothetical protein
MQRRITLKNHIATVPPIAAVWSPTRDVLLATKADTPVTALATAYKNFCGINKYHLIPWQGICPEKRHVSGQGR